MDSDHLCKNCHWNQYQWCEDGRKIANTGDCKRWRPIKLSEGAKKKHSEVMKAAHARDVDNRKRNKGAKRKVKGDKGA